MILSRLRVVFQFPATLSQRIAVAAILAMTSGALEAQDQTVVAHNSKGISSSSIDISLGSFGQLTPARTPTDITRFQNGITYDQTIQGTTSSAGVLGTIHQSFKPWLGYSVNFGYSRFSEHYSQGTYSPNPSMPTNPYSNFGYVSIGENVYELSGAALAQGPRTKRFDTFFQLGAGALTFLPIQNPSPYWVLFRPVMVFGTGANYKLSQHWALRAEYRGLFYKSPSYTGTRTADTNVPTVKLYTVTSEPTISIVYRFGGKR